MNLKQSREAALNVTPAMTEAHRIAELEAQLTAMAAERDLAMSQLKRAPELLNQQNARILELEARELELGAAVIEGNSQAETLMATLRLCNDPTTAFNLKEANALLMEARELGNLEDPDSFWAKLEDYLVKHCLVEG